MTAVIITTPSNAITPRSIKGFEGYLISRTSYPRTTDGSKCIMIKLKSTDDNPKECLITAFDDEAIALSKFIATLL